MPRVDDVTLLAILVRESLRRVDVHLLIDHVALKAALKNVLDESEVRVFMQSTRLDVEDPLTAASDALRARSRKR